MHYCTCRKKLDFGHSVYMPITRDVFISTCVAPLVKDSFLCLVLIFALIKSERLDFVDTCF